MNFTMGFFCIVLGFFVCVVFWGGGLAGGFLHKTRERIVEIMKADLFRSDYLKFKMQDAYLKISGW